MKPLNFLVSLATEQNDYQRAQATAAEHAARRLDVNLRIVYANNDGLQQSQQLLEAIQSNSSHLDGIVFQPVGTSMERVAEAALAKGIAWVSLHRRLDRAASLRKANSVPVFSISSNHEDEGRIQGEQFSILLPKGGIALYILGPTMNTISDQRLAGLKQAKPANIELRTIRGSWTEQSGYDAILSWLRLSTSQQLPIAIIGSQNDSMAMGARRALQESVIESKERVLNVPFIGCDGVPDAGQKWVQRGLLTATVILPPLAGIGVEMLAQSLRSGSHPPEHTEIKPESYPPLTQLKRG